MALFFFSTSLSNGFGPYPIGIGGSLPWDKDDSSVELITVFLLV
jgi:hypothetical protein